MKKEMKLIGLDLDGTTFTNDKKITAHTKEVIERAIEHGIVVLPCTGRPRFGAAERIFINERCEVCDHIKWCFYRGNGYDEIHLSEQYAISAGSRYGRKIIENRCSDGNLYRWQVLYG